MGFMKIRPLNRFSGWQPWQTTLAVMFFAQMLTAVGFSIIFPFLPLYVEALGTETSLSTEFWAGMVFSAQGITMMIAAPIWGALADRYGRKLMVMRAMFGGALILLLMAFVTSAEQLVLLRAIQGLVTGTVSAANALVAATVPRERMGFAMGTIQMGLWGGIAVGPLIGGVLADLFGFAMPFILTSVLLFFSGLMVWRGIREEFIPPTHQEGSHRVSIIQEWRHVVRQSGVPLIFVIRFINGVGRSMIIPIAPLFIVSLLPAGTTAESTYAGLAITISSAASTFTGIYLGRLGDRIGHRVILIGCAAATALFYIPQTFVTGIGQFLLLQLMIGLAAGGIISAPSALLVWYTERGEEGAVYGLDQAIVSGGRAIAPLVGAGIAVAIGLRGTFLATGLLFIVVALVAAAWLPRGSLIRASQPAAGQD